MKNRVGAKKQLSSDNSNTHNHIMIG